MKIVEKYVAENGGEFTTVEACRAHEDTLPGIIAHYEGLLQQTLGVGQTYNGEILTKGLLDNYKKRWQHAHDEAKTQWGRVQAERAQRRIDAAFLEAGQ